MKTQKAGLIQDIIRSALNYFTIWDNKVVRLMVKDVSIGI
jgi:hypothetical protein